ncbi:MAG: hypothetical protein ACE5GS_09675 [Kiloniellaceae bacterium]
MALRIETFSNVKGGNAFFKAIGHPLTARRMPDLLARLGARPVAVYDPLGYAATLAEIYDLGGLEIAGVFVQDLSDLGKTRLGHPAQPVTDLKACAARTVLVTAFDARRPIEHIRHLLPAGADVVSLDAVRLPDDMLTVPRDYVNGLNFATNFVFFRDAAGQHTRLITANYWSGYGAAEPQIWCCLMDGEGAALAEWREPLPGANGTIVIDSAEVRRRFGLGEFTGQLFIHVLRVAGHDVVKYALDTYGEEAGVLSCTHDANAWPADLYAGLPAPGDGERVILWVQNSHPAPIPAGGVGLNVMGRGEVAWLQREVAAFGTYAMDTRELLPDARWPQQVEIRAGKHFVRPRYEVFAANGRSRIAHANVERVDLKPDPRIAELSNLMGKGYILPAPVLPPGRFRSIVLPTPMATCQEHLPVKVLVYDSQGREVGAAPLGRLPRDHATALDAGAILAGGGASGEGANGREERQWGHMELVYDFAEGGEADGWLHGLFRYEDTVSGHAAETSFGAHMFNTVLTYRGEPQSYVGRAPGLSTRLFLRLGQRPYDTLCHLIYPASTPWHARSSTRLNLHDAAGAEIASREVAIPCGGSLLWRVSGMFGTDDLDRAGDGAYVLVRDVTCRLFGYHGLVNGETAFSFDHMFGF